MSPWIVYIIECSDKTLYTGITNDLHRRLEQHEAGTGAKYTRGRSPFQVKYTEYFAERSSATRREMEIKRMSRKAKMKLIVSGNGKPG